MPGTRIAAIPSLAECKSSQPGMPHTQAVSPSTLHTLVSLSLRSPKGGNGARFPSQKPCTVQTVALGNLAASAGAKYLQGQN